MKKKIKNLQLQFIRKMSEWYIFMYNVQYKILNT